MTGRWGNKTSHHRCFQSNTSLHSRMDYQLPVATSVAKVMETCVGRSDMNNESVTPCKNRAKRVEVICPYCKKNVMIGEIEKNANQIIKCPECHEPIKILETSSLDTIVFSSGESGGNVWISFLMILAWVAFFGTIGVGFWQTNNFAKASENEIKVWVTGICATLVVAFGVVAPTTVYLNLAKDVSTIKNILARKE